MALFQCFVFLLHLLKHILALTLSNIVQVRWADVEEKMQQKKMRDLGFVVGQTNWSRMTDPTFGESALTKTKYI